MDASSFFFEDGQCPVYPQGFGDKVFSQQEMPKVQQVQQEVATPQVATVYTPPNSLCQSTD